MGNSANLNLSPPLNVSNCQTFFLHTTVSDGNVEGKYTKRIRRLDGDCTECAVYQLLRENNNERLILQSQSFEKPNISIFPNPNLGSFKLRYDSRTAENFTFEIFDVTGKVVETINQYIFEGENFIYFSVSRPMGSYFVRATSEQINFHHPFIIKK